MNHFGFKKALCKGKLGEGIFFLVLGGSLLGYSLVEQYGGGAPPWKLSPYLFPALVGLLLSLLALSLLWEAPEQAARPEDARPEEPFTEEPFTEEPPMAQTASEASPQNPRRGWVVLGAAVLYLLLLPTLTFLPATVLLLAGLFYYLGERRLRLVALLSVGTALSCYGIFALLLRVMLP